MFMKIFGKIWVFIYRIKLNKKYIMKKVVRLTERELTRIVKRVINEQMTYGESQVQPVNLTPQQKDSLMKKFILDFQKTNGLLADGVVNNQTYTKLMEKGYITK